MNKTECSHENTTVDFEEIFLFDVKIIKCQDCGHIDREYY